jgi:hypothetical protein
VGTGFPSGNALKQGQETETMARRKKKIVPDIMRPQPLEPFTPSDAAIDYQLKYRWYYHQAASALDFPLWCPRQHCRRLHACLSFEPHADFRAEPIKLYPVCIRSYDAARLLQSTLSDIIKRAEARHPGNAFDPAYAIDFIMAARDFSRARIEAAKAAKEAAERAARAAQAWSRLWKKKR